VWPDSYMHAQHIMAAQHSHTNRRGVQFTSAKLCVDATDERSRSSAATWLLTSAANAHTLAIDA
jgi:hypothetical protein